MCFANPILAEIYWHFAEFSICPVLSVCQCVVCSPWLLLTANTFSDHRNAPAPACSEAGGQCGKDVTKMCGITGVGQVTGGAQCPAQHFLLLGTKHNFFLGF